MNSNANRSPEKLQWTLINVCCPLYRLFTVLGCWTTASFDLPPEGSAQKLDCLEHNHIFWFTLQCARNVVYYALPSGGNRTTRWSIKQRLCIARILNMVCHYVGDVHKFSI